MHCKFSNLKFLKPSYNSWRFFVVVILFEPWHVISNNVVCAISKGSDQPAHTHSLIRAFACRLNMLWVLSYWLNIIWSFYSLKGGCTASSESTLVKMPHCWKSHVAAHLVLHACCFDYLSVFSSSFPLLSLSALYDPWHVISNNVAFWQV